MTFSKVKKIYTFKLKCYKCGKVIPYQTQNPEIKGRYKRCYYCNNNINIHKCQEGFSINYS